jgi:predicted MPP superfamily phosphohydrolase
MSKKKISKYELKDKAIKNMRRFNPILKSAAENMCDLFFSILDCKDPYGFMSSVCKNSYTTNGGIVFDLKNRDEKNFSILVTPNHEIPKNIEDYSPILGSAGANMSDFFSIIQNCKDSHRFMESLNKDSYTTNVGIMFNLKNLDGKTFSILVAPNHEISKNIESFDRILSDKTGMEVK